MDFNADGLVWFVLFAVVLVCALMVPVVGWGAAMIWYWVFPWERVWRTHDKSEQ